MQFEDQPSLPTLAFTANAGDPASRLRWIGDNAAAVEFSPNPDRLDQLPELIRPFVRADLPVRFHTRYFQHELGHADPRRAASALEAHKRTLEAMAGLSEPVVTVHTGLDPAQPVRVATILENLSRLVEYAQDLGIVVCLENLRQGNSADPRNVLEWASAAGAMITLDLGHALGSDVVRDGRCSVQEHVDLFAQLLFEVHIYGWEDEHGHHPIKDMAPFKPIMASLLRTQCAWWTVELHPPAEALATGELISRFLREGAMESDGRGWPGMSAGHPPRADAAPSRLPVGRSARGPRYSSGPNPHFI